MDEDRKIELMMRDKADLSDTELAELVVAMNEPTKVPPCCVCGAELEATSAGWGVFTLYRCPSEEARFIGKTGDAYNKAFYHFRESEFEDRRQLDPWAYELAFRIVNLSEA